jgi:hypothetical protein
MFMLSLSFSVSVQAQVFLNARYVPDAWRRSKLSEWDSIVWDENYFLNNNRLLWITNFGKIGGRNSVVIFDKYLYCYVVASVSILVFA